MRGQGGLLGVKHPPLPAVRFQHRVINADIPEIQGILQDAVGVGPVGAVGAVGGNIVFTDAAFVGNSPFSGVAGVADLDLSFEVIGCFQRFIHELLDVLLVDPGGPQAHLNFRGVQILGLGGD